MRKRKRGKQTQFANGNDGDDKFEGGGNFYAKNIDACKMKYATMAKIIASIVGNSK